jgi:Tol biopolymer transport system component
MFNCKCRLLAFSAIAIALAALSQALLLAAKPGGGGGGGSDSTGGGTIYFSYPSGTEMQVAMMNADGTGKSDLATSGGEPSRLLHGGHRWFLRMEFIVGEFYPNGDTRAELFAERDDGAVRVQLTTDPELESQGGPNWEPGDLAVSWIARRWDFETGEVVDAGIYEAVLVFDANGNLSGLLEQPLSPLISSDLIIDDRGYLAPDTRGGHDWSPDGTMIVSDRESGHELWLTDVLTGQSWLLVEANWATLPVWSPDGTTIAFMDAFRGIGTIRADGSNLKNIAKGGPTYSYAWPVWSPTGSHLTFTRHDSWAGGEGMSVYRSTADGRFKTNLTPELDRATAIGWR